MTDTPNKMLSLVFKLTPEQVRRAVGLVLAKNARRNYRHLKRTGYRSGGLELDMQKISWALNKVYAPNGSGIKHWAQVNEFFNEKRIRAALKHWEKEGKVISRRHGQHGNGYRWVLLTETNELDRRKRHRAIRAELAKKANEERALKTAEAQAVADQLAAALNLEEKLVAYSNGATLSASQMRLILAVLTEEKVG